MKAWTDLPLLAKAARRALPEIDPAIESLGAGERTLLAKVWNERAASEHGAGAVFSTVAHALFAEGVNKEILWLASRAACDELRHAEICRYVASRYAGDAPLPPSLPRLPEPTRGSIFLAVAHCAINETVGSAFLSACQEEASGELARAALRELATDEIDHARIGWALLGADSFSRSSSGVLRCELEPRLLELIGVVRDAWLLRAAELPEELPRGHGCLSGPDVVRVVEEALAELVLPGFRHMGFEVPMPGSRPRWARQAHHPGKSRSSDPGACP